MNTSLKGLRWIVLATAFAGMGISMPSCPGQQAMQQQIDSLQATNADLNKRVQAMDGQVKKLQGDFGQVTPILKQMADAIEAQKGAIAQLDTSVKNIQQSMQARTAAKPAAKGKSKPRH